MVARIALLALLAAVLFAPASAAAQTETPTPELPTVTATPELPTATLAATATPEPPTATLAATASPAATPTPIATVVLAFSSVISDATDLAGGVVALGAPGPEQPVFLAFGALVVGVFVLMFVRALMPGGD